MLFQKRFWAPIAAGDVTLTFRRWKRQQVLPGNLYRTAAGRLLVDSVEVIDPLSISDDDAHRAGYPTAAGLVADLPDLPDVPVYRIAFHLAGGADPRDELASTDDLGEDELHRLKARLARLDRASKSGPWTDTTLDLIAANPAVRAGDLAPQLGMELLDFKVNVRKLKNLGLTISLGTGYRLSPRGEAFRAKSDNSLSRNTG